MSAAKKDQLAALHQEVAKELKKRVSGGDASAADIANAIKFLKDNGIESLPEANEAVNSLAREFPTFGDDEAEDKRPTHNGTSEVQ